VSEFDLPLALLRGLHVAAMISGAGALLFRVAVMRGATLGACTSIARANLSLAFVTGVVWLVVATQSIAGASGLADTFAALPPVMRDTRFGMLLTARLALLLIAVATAAWDGRRLAVPLGASFAALMLQPFLGHAAAANDWALAATETLHLTAAAAWLGGLPPLLLLVSRAPARLGIAMARRFSPIALASVLVLAGTALVQAAALIGSVAGLTGTAYGEADLTKTALFAVLLVCAALNRFVFAGSLGDRRPEEARRRLRTSLRIEIALGLAVVLAAGVLASLPPAGEAMHMQPQ